MKTVIAIYENGVFRPLEKVDLPEHARVEFALPEPESPSPPPIHPTLAAVYEAMSFRFDSGRHDLAERHNEHQP